MENLDLVCTICYKEISKDNNRMIFNRYRSCHITCFLRDLNDYPYSPDLKRKINFDDLLSDPKDSMELEDLFTDPKENMKLEDLFTEPKENMKLKNFFAASKDNMELEDLFTEPKENMKLKNFLPASKDNMELEDLFPVRKEKVEVEEPASVCNKTISTPPPSKRIHKPPSVHKEREEKKRVNIRQQLFLELRIGDY